MERFDRSRWRRNTVMVADCLVLDINRWTQEEVLRTRVTRSGGWTWSHAHTGDQRAAIGYTLDTTDMTCPWVQLYYLHADPGAPDGPHPPPDHAAA